MIVVTLDSGKKFIRLENLMVTNGTDLFVYLATDMSASDFVDIDRLMANIGTQNYTIPTGTDITKYDSLVYIPKN